MINLKGSSGGNGNENGRIAPYNYFGKIRLIKIFNTVINQEEFEKV